MLTPSPVQTTYTRYINVGQVGMPATTTGWDISTRICEDLSSPKVGIGFGLIVTQGTLHGDRSAAVGQGSGSTVIGITAADHTLPSLVTGVAADHYSDGDNMAVMTRGDIWVTAADTVLAGGPVYYNSSTGALGASGISNATLLAGAMWLTGAPTASTDIMKVEVGMLAVVRLVALGEL
jgi:hypothetical protein